LFGAALLGISLAVQPGSGAFYSLSAATALVWLAGGLLSGPLRLGRIGGHRPIVVPVLLGLVAAGVFVAGALIVRQIGPLADQVRDILEFAEHGNLPVVLLVTALSGIGEEVFFRGAVYAAAIRVHPVVVSAALYTLTTVVTGNVMLVFAGAFLSVIWGLQRRASAGVLAPILTHVTWSLAMALALPPIFGL
jgi:membrane protease YdiL (CAAX protease family)